MRKQQMQLASELIKRQDYTRARALLAQVDHPKAREWERKLDTVAPPEARPVKVRRKRKSRRYFVAALIVLISIMTLLVVQYRQDSSEKADDFRVYFDAFEYCIRIYVNLDMFPDSRSDMCSDWSDLQVTFNSEVVRECRKRAGPLDSEFHSCLIREDILPPGVVRN